MGRAMASPLSWFGIPCPSQRSSAWVSAHWTTAPKPHPLGQLPCDLALGVNGMQEFGQAHTRTDEATGARERSLILAHVAQDGREHLRAPAVDHGREPRSRGDFVLEYRRRRASLRGAAHVAQQR